MKRILAGLLLVVAACAVAPGAEIEERVINLPDYSGKWFVTIVYGEPAGPKDRALKDFLHSNKAMVGLQKQVNWHEWTDSTKWVRETAWQSYLGAERPVFLLQAPSDENGQAAVVLFLRGDKLIQNLRRLPNILQDAITIYSERHGWSIRRPLCPGPVCPVRPQPSPQPQPDATPPAVVVPPAAEPITPTVVDPEPEPEPEPETPAEGSGLSVGWLLAILAAGGAGIWSEFRKNAG